MSLANASGNAVCPHCGATLAIAADMAGQVVRCYRCQGQMSIPSAKADELLADTDFGQVYRNRLELPGETLIVDSIEAVNIDIVVHRPMESTRTFAGVALAGSVLVALCSGSALANEVTAAGVLTLILCVSVAIAAFAFLCHPASNPKRREYRAHLLLKSGRTRSFASWDSPPLNDFVQAVKRAIRVRG